MSLYRFFLLLFLASVLPGSLFAQSGNISCSFTADTIVTGYGQTFSNKLRLENKSGRLVILTQVATTDDGLLRLPDTILLKPGITKYIPVKFLTSAALFSKPSKRIIISYINQSDSKSVGAGFVVRLNQPDRVVVSTSEPIVYLNNATGMAQFKLHCSNKGYTTLNLQLKLTVNPVGLQLFTPFRTLTLEPGGEQTLDFEARLMNNDTGYSPDFNIVIECNNQSGVNLTTAMVHITALQSNKRQNGFTGQSNQLSNTTELSYTNLNKSYTYYGFRSNGTVDLSKNSNLNYNLNLNYYNRQNAFEGYDSWIAYNNKYFSLKAGNLMENLDYTLYGRGLKSSLFLDQHSSVDLYYVRNSYFLFSQITNELPGASVFGGSYNFSTGGGTAKMNLLFSHNPLTGLDTRFINGYTHIKLSPSQFIELRGGYSEEQETGSGSSQTGAAGGLTYTNRSRILDINLNNYYSSAYYSGLQRGTLQLDDQLNFHIGHNTGIFTHYELINNSPKYLVDTLSNLGFYNNTLKYEVGFNLNIKGLSITLHPYVFKQDVNQSYNSNYLQITSPISSSSIRTGLDFIYGINPGQQVSVLSDFGKTHSDNPALLHHDYRGFKIDAGYLNKWWGLTALVQNGPYYLSEEIIAAYLQKDYHVYSVGPNIHISGFNNKFSLNFNDYLNFATYSVSKNNALNAQTSYRFPGNWLLSGQAFYNTYATTAQVYSLQTRLAISKQFVQTHAPGLNSLKMRFFEDQNNDGILNQNEKSSGDLIINLIPNNSSSSNNDLTTISNKNGEVVYSNLKPGTYVLTVIRGNGLHLAHQVVIDLIKNRKLIIPLIKSGWLKGHILPVRQEYTRNKLLLEGLKIIATDNENQTFTTLTDDMGEFELSLPINTYHLTVDADPQKYSINNPNQEIHLLQSGNKEIQFNLVDESRKTIIKQF